MARQLVALGQPLLGVALPVSNVPGASGNTGLAQLLAGKPDGYTIATYIQDTLMTIPMGLARHKVDDFEWIARTQVADSFLFVKADSPFRTIQELFKHAQANPGKLRVAATGFGTVDDVTVRFLEKKGYKMTTVPYPKPGERYAAALGGHAEVLYEQAGDVLQYLKAGQLKPLVIFAEQRHPAFADVPDPKELGIDVTLPQFRGIVAQKGTPPESRAGARRRVPEGRWTRPQWKKFAEEWYFAPDSYMGPEGFGKWVASEVDHARPAGERVRAQAIEAGLSERPLTVSWQLVARLGCSPPLLPLATSWASTGRGAQASSARGSGRGCARGLAAPAVRARVALAAARRRWRAPRELCRHEGRPTLVARIPSRRSRWPARRGHRADRALRAAGARPWLRARHRRALSPPSWCSAGTRSLAALAATVVLGTLGLLYLFVKLVYLPLPKGDGPFEAAHACALPWRSGIF